MPVQASANAQINRLTDTILQYLLQSKLIGKRGASEMDYLAAQQEGNIGLENLRTSNNMKQLQEQFALAVDQLPPLKNVNTRIQNAQRTGAGGLPALIEEKKRLVKQQMPYILSSIMGDMKGINMDTLAPFMESVVDDSINTQYSMANINTMQQGRQLESTAVSQQLTKRGQDITMRGQDIETRGQDIKLMDLGDEDRKLWIQTVTDAEKFLDDQGVSPTSVQADQLPAMFASNKTLDPLDSNLRGEAYQWLEEIRGKILYRQPISQQDLFFLQRVRNSSAIRASGALPSRETGTFPGESPPGAAALGKDQARETMIQYYMQQYGLTRENATVRVDGLMQYVK